MRRKDFYGYTIYEDGSIDNKNGFAMKQSGNPNGYSQVCITSRPMMEAYGSTGNQRSFFVHQLVAHVFLGYKLFNGKSSGSASVHHKDRIKSNNDVSNLEVTTMMQNKQNERKYDLPEFISYEKKSGMYKFHKELPPYENGKRRAFSRHFNTKEEAIAFRDGYFTKN